MHNPATPEPARDLLGYGPEPPLVEWPNGRRLAVNIAINYEEGAEASPLAGDAARDSRTWVLAPDLPPSERDLNQEGEWEYGSRVGIWRLLRMFNEFDMPFSVFATAKAVEMHPPLTEALRHAPCDIVAHGLRSVRNRNAPESEQRANLRTAIDLLETLTGKQVLSSFAPPLTTATRRLVAEEGLLYDSATTNDDIPYYAIVANRPLLVVPYALDTNDARFWGGCSGPGFMTGDEFFGYLRDALELLRREARHVPRMMSIGLHARIMRPARAMALYRFLDHLHSLPDVWVAGRNDIALTFAQQFAPPDAWNFSNGHYTAERRNAGAARVRA